MHNTDLKKKKLDDRAFKGILMGYGKHSKGYIVCVPSKHCILLSRTIRFTEQQPAITSVHETEEGTIPDDNELV